MVKVKWVIVAFVGGLAAGVLATRMSRETPTPEAQASLESRAAPRVPDTPSSSVESSAAPSERPSTVTGATHPDSAKATPTTPVAALPESRPAESDAAVQRIDAGEVFNEIIARPSQPGFENQIGDAHRALERETRDDGWSYTMEAEIQNLMINEVSTGAFRAEHVECRATMCEIRLSGKGDQTAALEHWVESVGPQPFGQRLFLSSASSISSNGRSDTLMIFRRPPK